MTSGPRAIRPLSLLEQVQRLLERTYRMRSGVREPGRFIIGDRGYRWLYRDRSAASEARSTAGQGARVLLRETPAGTSASIYYPDALIARLERHPPQRGLHEGNVDAFAALVEELDHLLVVAERVRMGREVSLFELELHANVSKHLVLTRFLAGRRTRLSASRRLWLRHQLFVKNRFREPDSSVQQRYRDATRWAVRFLDRLAGLAAARRIETLRVFHRASLRHKLELIDRSPA